ncbi:nucleoside diphosphate kinase regulator [Oceanospirillum maris]|uniref:nucleoside diphosphate kinase regulator n=1 Tax=Oceanospirillum maris TaxID=64977 RepID=UPI000402980F|nr:nucleoside diphosphate kinase regulator [Oceanospirillum maris]
MQNTQPDIVVSEHDAEMLDELLAKVSLKDFPGKANLEKELDRASIVPSAKIPANVVTMNSKVRFKDTTSEKSFIMTLVYPKNAGQEGTISVLAPVGSALLGLSVGQNISWPKPAGGEVQMMIEEILYQPERDGAKQTLDVPEPK